MSRRNNYDIVEDFSHSLNEDYNVILKALPDMSETEKDIAIQCLKDGYSVGETIDHILYGSIGGYSLEEYIQCIAETKED